MSRTFFFFTGTILMIVVMLYHGAPLNTCKTPKKIVDLEICWSTGRADTIIAVWKDPSICKDCPSYKPASVNLLERAKSDIWLDYIFIFFYAGFFYTLFRRFYELNNKWYFKIAFIAAIIMGTCDVIENINMQLLLYNGPDTLYTKMAAVFAYSKAFLLLILTIWGLVSLIGLLDKKKEDAL